MAEIFGRLVLAALVAMAGIALIFGAERMETAAEGGSPPVIDRGEDETSAPGDHAATTAGAAAGAAGHTAPGHSFWPRVLDELGFALLIASGVWLIFELQLRLNAEKEFSHRLTMVSRNVFDAVLGNNLPTPFIGEVKRVALGVRLVRTSFTAHYTIKDATFEAAPGVTQPYVELVALMSFTVKNVSAADVAYRIEAALPNPVHPKLKELIAVRLVEGHLHNKPIKLDLVKAEKNFRERLKKASGFNVAYSAGQVLLRPSEELQLRFEVVTAKEEEDSELLELALPCDGLTISITETNPAAPRRTFARSIHRIDKEAIATPANPLRLSLTIEEYFLPHQGVLIGWKRINDVPPALPAPLPTKPRAARKKAETR